MGHRKKSFVDQSMLQAGEGRLALHLSRLRWLGIVAPTVFGGLLLWFTLAFHHTPPLWLLVVLVFGISAAGATLGIEHGRLYETQCTLEATVEARTRELQATNHRLEETSRHRSQFLANVSHELRTPLNSIIGFSDLLQDPTFGTLTAKQAHYAQNILVSGQHLLGLVNDLLDLSKVEAGKCELQPETFSLPDAIKAAFRIIWPQAEAKQQVLEFQVADDLPAIRADLVRFKQILCNLLSNAVKFTPEGGAVTVSASPLTSGWIEIAVQDTGIGIKAEDLPKLFQPFTQLESPMTKQNQGTGLGLALTKHLVELHGGQIAAASEGEGLGSTFTVCLPLPPQVGSWVMG